MDTGVRRRPLAAWQVHRAEPSTLGLGAGVRVLPDELKAAIVLFYSLLDEQQRRLYAGLARRVRPQTLSWPAAVPAAAIVP